MICQQQLPWQIVLTPKTMAMTSLRCHSHTLSIFSKRQILLWSLICNTVHWIFSSHNASMYSHCHVFWLVNTLHTVFWLVTKIFTLQRACSKSWWPALVKGESFVPYHTLQYIVPLDTRHWTCLLNNNSASHSTVNTEKLKTRVSQEIWLPS